MKSFLFPVPQRQPQGDESEEGVALVPPPQSPPDDDDHGAAGGGDPAAVVNNSNKQQLDEEELICSCSQTTTGEEQAANRQPAAWWSWPEKKVQRLLPTRGAGLLIGGLVVLALLVGTATTWWTHLDYASSFLLGGGGGGIFPGEPYRPWPTHHMPSPADELVPIPFVCGAGNNNTPSEQSTGTCRPRGTPAAATIPSPSPSSSSHTPPPRCPDYFRYIHADLSPWRSSGITREAVERGRGRAAFRLVVVSGRAFVETYHRVFQTRDTFTQWGIAQLLARYPGRVPDLDLMFNCEDMPEVRRADFAGNLSAAPPLFRYCKDGATLDVVFPDWSFWGWPEVNIRPWAPLLGEMAADMAARPWAAREPYAFWKGNPGVSGERRDLLRCNSTERWRARVFAQDWGAAARAGFRDGSNLAEQCRYRYKIFVRGRSWSVSEKYILACDSPTLLVATPFEDFLSRGLVAGRHYWPVDPARKCAAVRAAVDWGNAHPAQARRMAEAGSGFARGELAMDYVFDYMLHLLTEYARLLRYKPTVPEKAVELCPESLACRARGRERRFMMESRERFVADYEPCVLPPPFTEEETREMAQRDREVRAKVHEIEMTMEQQEKHG